ncbi:MAG TPA: signal peptidase I [Chloroflexota bacterium]|nr:signal peptidase I [Chloroflexota bacterium]
MARLKILANAVSVVLTGAALASLLGVSILPGVFGYKTYTVLSGSMEPAIHTGSMLVALPVPPESLKVGDVIVYNRSDVSESVTHRIVQVNNDKGRPTFVTKGDANGAPDSWTVQYNGNTAGKVVMSVPFLGYAYNAVASPRGRIVFLVMPVVVLSLMWLASIWRPSHKIGRIEKRVPRTIAPAPNVPIMPSAAEATAAADLTSKAEPPPLPLRQ